MNHSRLKSVLLASAFWLGAFFGQTPDASALPKEAPAATAAHTQATLTRTLNTSRCVAHISLTIVNKNDRVVIESHNKIAGAADESFVEGSISGDSRLDGAEYKGERPYYLVRSGGKYYGYTEKDGVWSSSDSPWLNSLFSQDLGLFELLGKNGGACLLNDTDKARTILISADPLPFARFFQNITALGGNRHLASIDETKLKKLKPIDITIRIATESQRIQDVNVDVSKVIAALLDAAGPVPEATPAQQKFRTLLESGITNLHISVSNFDELPKFKEVLPLPELNPIFSRLAAK